MAIGETTVLNEWKIDRGKTCIIFGWEGVSKRMGSVWSQEQLRIYKHSKKGKHYSEKNMKECDDTCILFEKEKNMEVKLWR